MIFEESSSWTKSFCTCSHLLAWVNTSRHHAPEDATETTGTTSKEINRQQSLLGNQGNGG